MREILDNSSRAHIVHNWPVRDYFDALVALIKLNPGLEKTSYPLVFTFVFQVLGATLCFSVSRPALKHMYGEEKYTVTRNHFLIELQNHIRWFLAAAEKEHGEIPLDR